MGRLKDVRIEWENSGYCGRNISEFINLRDSGLLDGDLEIYAKLLGGDVAGEFVRCPSPHHHADDRSCFLRIHGRGQFFIYACEGHLAAAYAYVRERLKLGPFKPNAANSALALRILSQTTLANGTLVDTYLRSRMLTVPIPPNLRFHPNLKHAATGGFWPVMVAERVDGAGRATGIHRTYLARDGSSKASIEPQRMDLGRSEDGAIRLSPAAAELLVGEGIETTLAAMQLLGLPGWAAGSAVALRKVTLPAMVKAVIVLADNDEAGIAAAHYAAQRWLLEGRRVRIARSPIGNDFNDLLVSKAGS